MEKIVVDSSVFIDYVRSRKGDYIELADLSRSKKAKLYVPTIVIFELWKGKSMSDPGNQKIIRRMISATKIIPFSRQLAEQSGELVRSAIILASEDAIVAATALHLDAKLATGNKKHFEKVKDLRFFAPK